MMYQQVLGQDQNQHLLGGFSTITPERQPNRFEQAPPHHMPVQGSPYLGDTLNNRTQDLNGSWFSQHTMTQHRAESQRESLSPMRQETMAKVSLTLALAEDDFDYYHQDHITELKEQLTAINRAHLRGDNVRRDQRLNDLATQAIDFHYQNLPTTSDEKDSLIRLFEKLVSLAEKCDQGLPAGGHVLKHNLLELYNVLGYVYFDLENYEKALEMFLAAFESSKVVHSLYFPVNRVDLAHSAFIPELLWNTAKCQLLLHQHRAALQTCKSLAYHVESRIQLNQVWLKDPYRDVDAKNATAQSIEKLHNCHLQSQLLKGDVYLDCGKYQQAIAEYKQCQSIVSRSYLDQQETSRLVEERISAVFERQTKEKLDEMEKHNKLFERERQEIQSRIESIRSAPISVGGTSGYRRTEARTEARSGSKDSAGNSKSRSQSRSPEHQTKSVLLDAGDPGILSINSTAGKGQVEVTSYQREGRHQSRLVSQSQQDLPGVKVDKSARANSSRQPGKSNVSVQKIKRDNSTDVIRTIKIQMPQRAGSQQPAPVNDGKEKEALKRMIDEVKQDLKRDRSAKSQQHEMLVKFQADSDDLMTRAIQDQRAQMEKIQAFNQERQDEFFEKLKTKMNDPTGNCECDSFEWRCHDCNPPPPTHPEYGRPVYDPYFKVWTYPYALNLRPQPRPIEDNTGPTTADFQGETEVIKTNEKEIGEPERGTNSSQYKLPDPLPKDFLLIVLRSQFIKEFFTVPGVLICKHLKPYAEFKRTGTQEILMVHLIYNQFDFKAKKLQFTLFDITNRVINKKFLEVEYMDKFDAFVLIQIIRERFRKLEKHIFEKSPFVWHMEIFKQIVDGMLPDKSISEGSFVPSCTSSDTTSSVSSSDVTQKSEVISDRHYDVEFEVEETVSEYEPEIIEAPEIPPEKPKSICIYQKKEIKILPGVKPKSGSCSDKEHKFTFTISILKIPLTVEEKEQKEKDSKTKNLNLQFKYQLWIVEDIHSFRTRVMSLQCQNRKLISFNKNYDLLRLPENDLMKLSQYIDMALKYKISNDSCNIVDVDLLRLKPSINGEIDLYDVHTYRPDQVQDNSQKKEGIKEGKYLKAKFLLKPEQIVRLGQKNSGYYGDQKDIIEKLNYGDRKVERSLQEDAIDKELWDCFDTSKYWCKIYLRIRYLVQKNGFVRKHKDWIIKIKHENKHDNVYNQDQIILHKLPCKREPEKMEQFFTNYQLGHLIVYLNCFLIPATIMGFEANISNHGQPVRSVMLYDHQFLMLQDKHLQANQYYTNCGRIVNKIPQNNVYFNQRYRDNANGYVSEIEETRIPRILNEIKKNGIGKDVNVQQQIENFDATIEEGSRLGESMVAVHYTNCKPEISKEKQQLLTQLQFQQYYGTLAAEKHRQKKYHEKPTCSEFNCDDYSSDEDKEVDDWAYEQYDIIQDLMMNDKFDTPSREYKEIQVRDALDAKDAIDFFFESTQIDALGCFTEELILKFIVKYLLVTLQRRQEGFIINNIALKIKDIKEDLIEKGQFINRFIMQYRKMFNGINAYFTLYDLTDHDNKSEYGNAQGYLIEGVFADNICLKGQILLQKLAAPMKDETEDYNLDKYKMLVDKFIDAITCKKADEKDVLELDTFELTNGAGYYAILAQINYIIVFNKYIDAIKDYIGTKSLESVIEKVTTVINNKKWIKYDNLKNLCETAMKKKMAGTLKTHEEEQMDYILKALAKDIDNQRSGNSVKVEALLKYITRGVTVGYKEHIATERKEYLAAQKAKGNQALTPIQKLERKEYGEDD